MHQIEMICFRFFFASSLNFVAFPFTHNHIHSLTHPFTEVALCVTIFGLLRCWPCFCRIHMHTQTIIIDLYLCIRVCSAFNGMLMSLHSRRHYYHFDNMVWMKQKHNNSNNTKKTHFVSVYWYIHKRGLNGKTIKAINYNFCLTWTFGNGFVKMFKHIFPGERTQRALT